jgi:hypothetical protein
VTGTFQGPDGTPLNGKIEIKLTRPTVTDICSTPMQIFTFRTMTVPVVNGVMNPITLHANACLKLQPPSTKTPVSFPLIGAGSDINGIGNAATSVTEFGPAGTNVDGIFALTTGTENTLPNAGIAKLTLWTNTGQTYCRAVTESAAYQTSYVFNATNGATSFVFSTGPALTVNTTYVWKYICSQPYLVRVFNSKNELLYTADWLVPIAVSVDVTELDVK